MDRYVKTVSMSSLSVFTLLVIICSAPACCPIKIMPRIVGGKCANLGESTYQVSLQNIATWKHFAGGSIVDDRHVITAAHCVYKSSASIVGVAAGFVRLSDPNQKKYLVEKMFLHEDFRPSLMYNDIAIIKIYGKFQFEKGKLETIVLRTTPTIQGIPVKSFGWGVSHTNPERVPDNLQVVDLITLNFGECAILYAKNSQTSMKLNKGMLCAGVVAGIHIACSGDGGGALVSHDSRLVGITSWGNDGCGYPQLPGIYTDVFHYKNWINKTLIASRNSGRPTFAGLVLIHKSLLVLYYLLRST